MTRLQRRFFTRTGIPAVRLRGHSRTLAVRPLKKLVAFTVIYRVNRVLQERSTTMKKGNRLRRTALVLALLVLAGICTGVAASATKTAVPKQLTGWWKRPAAGVAIHVNPGGKVEINFLDGTRPFHPEFSRVTTHRLSISGIRSCSGTGTYRWKVA